MSARTFERLVALALLAFATWYFVTMLSYPEGAGQIPAIVAAVMMTALVVQLALSFRAPAGETGPAPVRTDPPSAVSGALPLAAGPPAGDGAGLPASSAAGSPPDIEPDTYETLIRLTPTRRRLFLGIAVWTLLFYVGALAVGFVATFSVLFTALLMYVRERPVVAVVAGVLSGLVMYAFVSVFLELPAFTGFLLP